MRWHKAGDIRGPYWYRPTLEVVYLVCLVGTGPPHFRLSRTGVAMGPGALREATMLAEGNLAAGYSKLYTLQKGHEIFYMASDTDTDGHNEAF